MIKEYKFQNKKKFQVTYGYQGSKWNFRIGDFTLLTKVLGGKKVAEKIVVALRNSWLRCGKIDGTCRTVINRLTAVKSLADWKPDTDWWSNALVPGMESVKMVYVNQIPVKGFGEDDLPQTVPVKAVENEEIPMETEVEPDGELVGCE